MVIDNPIKCLKISCERDIIAYATNDSLVVHHLTTKTKIEMKHDSVIDDICLGQVDDVVITLSQQGDNTNLRIINTCTIAD